MEEPNYILKTRDSNLIYLKQNVIFKVVKIMAWSLAAVIVLCSLIFEDNLFAELSWEMRIIFVVILIGVTLFKGKRKYVPAPMELVFFEDRLVVSKPHKQYDSSLPRKEIVIMNYSDITKCVRKNRSQMVYIYGSGKTLQYKQRRNGSFPENPSKNKDFKDGLLFFDMQFMTDIDIKKEIEIHSPITVVDENS